MFSAGDPQPYLDSGGHTHAGRTRETNDDAFIVAELSRTLTLGASSTNLAEDTAWFEAPQGKLMVVADGITGAGAAEVASSVALDQLAEHITGKMPWRAGPDDAEIEAELRLALAACQDSIRDEARRRGLERSPVGTSIAVVYINWPRAYVAQVGDTRVYMMRQDLIESLTRDDTLANELVDRHVLDLEAASRWANVLVNAVGGENDEIDIEFSARDLVLGDQLLLCTDGVTRYLDDLEIAAVLSDCDDATDGCRRLVTEAIERGGEDNATAVLMCAEPEADTSQARFA